jgi:inhibitor of KinA
MDRGGRVGLNRGRLSPLGDCAVVVSFGDEITLETSGVVKEFGRRLAESPPQALVEYVPAFTNVTVVYDAATQTYDGFASELGSLLTKVSSTTQETDVRTVEIPVQYGGEFGPDLRFVASHNGLTEDDVVAIHSEPTYVVYMIGFAPGFPYLGGMSERIAAPRRDSPRAAIPAGSVGIAGRQTGVYSIETPGGWQLIGRSPLRLFRPEAASPSLLQAGDRVRFTRISRREYEDLAGGGGA